MDRQELLTALQRLGELLDEQTAIDVYLVGGAAGMISGHLDPMRTTADCDVMAMSPSDAWDAMDEAIKTVAEEMKLNDEWMNSHSRMYAWMMPIGWEGRCEHFTYGPIRVHAISRMDLIAAKSVNALKRPHDWEDIQHMNPTAEEIGHAIDNLRRVEAEHPDRKSFADQIELLGTLRGE